MLAFLALGIMFVASGGALSLVANVNADNLAVDSKAPTCEDPDWFLMATADLGGNVREIVATDLTRDGAPLARRAAARR